MVDNEFDRLSEETKHISNRALNKISRGDLNLEISPLSLRHYLTLYFSDIPAQNTLLVGEETVPLQGMIKANDSRLLSTFDPFRLICGSAIIYLPTSNISSLSPFLVTSTATTSDKMQILVLDGDTGQVAMLPSIKMPIEGNAYKTVLGEAFRGTDPFTGDQLTVDNIKALFLFNGSNQTITLGYGSSIALLTIVR